MFLSAREPGSLPLAVRHQFLTAIGKDPGQARAQQQGTLRHPCGLSGNAEVGAVIYLENRDLGQTRCPPAVPRQNSLSCSGRGLDHY